MSQLFEKRPRLLLEGEGHDLGQIADAVEARNQPQEPGLGIYGVFDPAFR
jgi:hypothetical protein